MEVLTNLSAAEVLDRAERFALEDEWATVTIKERTAESVTFARREPLTCSEWVLLIVGAIFTFGVALAYLIFRGVYTQEAGISVRPAEDGLTRVLIHGKHPGYRDLLVQWAHRELP